MNGIKPRDMDVNEIFDQLVKIKSRKNQVEWLRDNYSDHAPLLRIIKMNYCSTIVSMLPPGEPPFTKEETDGPSPAALWSYLRTFPVIVRSAQSMKMRAMQIEKIFIEMLEAITPAEAEMLCLAKDRLLETRWNFDVTVFEEAFPTLNIQSANMPKIEPEAVEVKVERMLDDAKALKDKAKAMTAQAKQLEKDAKSLVSEEAKDAAAE